MAAVAVIFGGMAGFVSALVSLVVFNASWLLALGIWSFGGTALAVLMIGLAMTGRQAKPEMVAETA